MSTKTENFRQQHDEMFKLVGEIQSKLNKDACEKEAAHISKTLTTLVGKLKIHLGTEDKFLYPTLLNGNDEQAKKIAQDFIKEMSGITQVVEQYFKAWMLPSNISKDPTQFIKQTQDLFSALGKRIEKEHKDLYPLLDKTA